MAKSAGTVLGIIGILLGAGGLGFGVISWFSLVQIPIQQSWHDSVELDGVSSTRGPIYDLSISMTLGAGQAIYVSFTCSVYLGSTLASLYIYIDDIFTGGKTQVSREGPAVGWYYFSASIQHVNNTLAPGAHTVTVWADASDSDSSVYDCVLYVRTI